MSGEGKKRWKEPSTLNRVGFVPGPVPQQVRPFLPPRFPAGWAELSANQALPPLRPSGCWGDPIPRYRSQPAGPSRRTVHRRAPCAVLYRFVERCCTPHLAVHVETWGIFHSSTGICPLSCRVRCTAVHPTIPSGPHRDILSHKLANASAVVWNATLELPTRLHMYSCGGGTVQLSRSCTQALAACEWSGSRG